MNRDLHGNTHIKKYSIFISLCSISQVPAFTLCTYTLILKINNLIKNSMKIITEIKKACCFNRFAFLVMSLGLIATFTACSSDDDSDIPVYSLKMWKVIIPVIC